MSSEYSFSDYWVWWKFGTEEKVRKLFHAFDHDPIEFLRKYRNACFADYKFYMDEDYFMSSCFHKRHIYLIEKLNENFTNVKFTVVDNKEFPLEIRGGWGEEHKYLVNREIKDNDTVISFPLVNIKLNENYTDNTKKYLYYIYSVMIRLMSTNENYLEKNEPQEKETALEFLLRLNNDYIRANKMWTGHVLSEKVISLKRFILLENIDLVNGNSEKNYTKSQYSNGIGQTNAIWGLIENPEEREKRAREEKEFQEKVRKEQEERNKRYEEERIRREEEEYRKKREEIRRYERYNAYEVYILIGDREYFLKKFYNFDSAKRSCRVRARKNNYIYFVKCNDIKVYFYKRDW